MEELQSITGAILTFLDATMLFHSPSNKDCQNHFVAWKISVKACVMSASFHVNIIQHVFLFQLPPGVACWAGRSVSGARATGAAMWATPASVGLPGTAWIPSGSTRSLTNQQHKIWQRLPIILFLETLYFKKLLLIHFYRSTPLLVLTNL